jgi:hypothetical protein
MNDAPESERYEATELSRRQPSWFTMQIAVGAVRAGAMPDDGIREQLPDD